MKPVTKHDEQIFDFGCKTIVNAIEIASTQMLLHELQKRGCYKISVTNKDDVFNIEVLKSNGESHGEFADDIQKRVENSKSLLLIPCDEEV